MKHTLLLSVLLFIPLSSVYADIRVLTVEEPPSSYKDPSLKARGYAVDVFKLLVKDTQLENHPTIEFIPEARVLNIAEQQPNVIFFAFSRTVLREDKFYWIGAVASKKWQIYSLKNAHISIQTIEELQHFPMIGVVRGDVREEWLIDRGFTNINSVTQHEQNVKLLLLGRLPVIAFEQQGLNFITSKLNEDPSLIRAVYTLNESKNYIAMSKKGTNKQLVSALQNRYQTILNNGSLNQLAVNWQEKLAQKYQIQSEIKNGILNF